MTSQNRTLRCAASTRYSKAGPNMLNGWAPALAGCDTEGVCDCEATTRSPSWNCEIGSFDSPNLRAFALQQLRPKINIGFDIGQRRPTLLCVGFVYCSRRQKRARFHAIIGNE